MGTNIIIEDIEVSHPWVRDILIKIKDVNDVLDLIESIKISEDMTRKEKIETMKRGEVLMAPLMELLQIMLPAKNKVHKFLTEAEEAEEMAEIEALIESFDKESKELN